MTNTSVKIKFESLNEHNFLIDVSGSSALNVLRGLTLLQDELPAELAFHVPEAYHKRIIGVAGRSIQRIMKKYGVYVKFNSAEEMRALALDDEENVLARTPAKNALNLDQLRASIMELVPAKDKDFIVDTVCITRYCCLVQCCVDLGFFSDPCTTSLPPCSVRRESHIPP